MLLSRAGISGATESLMDILELAGIGQFIHGET